MSAMACSRVHHGTVVVPAGASEHEVREAVERQARRSLLPDQQAAFVYLHGCQPAAESDTQMRWRYSYQVNTGGRPDCDRQRA